jgi:hypothetical protein
MPHFTGNSNFSYARSIRPSLKVRDHAGNIMLRDGEPLWELTELGRRAADDSEEDRP